MRLRCGSESFLVRVRPARDRLEVAVDGEERTIAVLAVAPAVFAVREGDSSSLLHVVREGRSLHLFWEGVAYELEEEREGARPASRDDEGALEAPMPGRVAAVRVAPGQRVSKGEELLVVEAMKMENALRAPRDGVVRALHAAAGDMVAPGRPLVEIE
jgi:3-methylcrotonyl-CoA carboxylase alpha subunit